MQYADTLTRKRNSAPLVVPKLNIMWFEDFLLCVLVKVGPSRVVIELVKRGSAKSTCPVKLDVCCSERSGREGERNWLLIKNTVHIWLPRSSHLFPCFPGHSTVIARKPLSGVPRGESGVNKETYFAEELLPSWMFRVIKVAQTMEQIT